MSFVMQRTYDKYQVKGQKGQISRPELQFEADSNGYVAGEKLRPGEGVYLNGSTYIKPTDLATQESVIGVVSLVQNSVNVDITSPSANNSSEIVVPSGSDFQIITSGHVFVELSGTVAKGDPAFPATNGSNTWVTATPTGTVKNPAFFDEAGVSGDVVSIRINGQVA